MVVALGPGKFYGSSLPRPRFYTDVKLNSERVDPPIPVMDPLMKWAEEAHWSMGGLNFKRLRLQGRIEGKVEKLRAQQERTFKKSQKQRQKFGKSSASTVLGKNQDSREISRTPSPPPAPVAIKRRRVVGLLDEEEDGHAKPRRGAVRKLGDEFERVASESGMPVDEVDESGCDGGSGGKRSEGTKKRRKLVKGGKKAAAATVRKSPRLSRK